MKFFIAISSLTLLFGFSTSKLFVLQYSEMINYCKLEEGTYVLSIYYSMLSDCG